MNNKDDVDAALAAAVANAALEGTHVTDEERELIKLHQSGAIDKAEFLRRAAEIAQAKAKDDLP